MQKRSVLGRFGRIHYGTYQSVFDLRRSATEAQRGLGFEVEPECAVEPEVEFRFEFGFELPSFESEFELLSSSPSSISSLKPRSSLCSSLSSSSSLVSVRVRARKPGKMLSECFRTPPGSAPGGTLETLPRDRPRTPGRDPEKDPFCQQVNNHRVVEDSSRK